MKPTGSNNVEADPRRHATFAILHDFPSLELEEAWRDCLSRALFAAHYNSPEFFAEPFWAGKRPFAVLALEQSAVVGALTGLHEGNEVICGLPSRPQICLDHRGDQAAAADALAQGLLAEAGPARLLSVYSWTQLDGFARYGFRARQLEGNIVLDLTQGPATAFAQFDENRRRNIRLAIRQGVEVFQASTSQDLLAFYDVYLKWRKTARKKIEGDQVPFETFEQAQALKANRRLFLARFSGRVIAGVSARFLRRGLLEFAANSSLDEFMRVRPNDLLQWRIIEWACAEGFPRYSLGGAHTFLRKFGGTLVPIYRYRLDRTLLRRHDLREAVLDTGRETLRKMPKPVEKSLRRIFGKT